MRFVVNLPVIVHYKRKTGGVSKGYTEGARRGSGRDAPMERTTLPIGDDWL